MTIDVEYLSNNSAGNLYWKDLQGRYSGANQAFKDLMNAQTPGGFIGKTDREIFSSVMTDEKLKIIEETDQRIIQSGEEEYLREEGVDIFGKAAFYITKKMPLRTKEGEIIGIMGTSLDITNEIESENRVKKAEATTLIARAKAISEEEMRKTVMVLVGDIVHDLRTPIAVIRTISSVLGDVLPNMLEILDEAMALGSKKTNLLTKKQMIFLRENRFISGLDDAVKMMDDFINTSLMELDNAQKDEHSDLTLIKCSSRRILERTLEAYPFGEGITFHENIPYDFDLMGNSILIMKILFNLLGNAVDQIKLNGKGEIYISTEASEQMNFIKVKDTAGGASPEVLAHLFKPYYTTKKEGTGIGLAFCKNAMKRFSGDLTCINVYGEHIEFILSFPQIKHD